MTSSPQSDKHVSNVSSVVDSEAHGEDEANRGGDLDVEAPEVHRADDVDEGESYACKHPQADAEVPD